MNKIPKIILLLVLALVILATGCTETGAAVGDRAPDFQLQDLEGNEVSLSSLRGSPILLNFWATWCPPCRLEMPFIQEVYQEWTDKGLVILAIDMGESAATVRDFMQNNNYTIPVLLDTRRVVSQKYNVTAIPTTFFIDRNGVIQDKLIGPFPSKDSMVLYVKRILTR